LAEVLSIDELRDRIDVIDNQLVRLLNVRVACAVEIGKLKHELGMPVYQPDREKKVLEKVRQSAQDLAGPLTSEAVVRIFERIIDEARRAERESSSTHEDFGPSSESSDMVVVMNERATEAQIDSVIQRLIELGMDVHRSSGVSRTVLGVVGAHKIDPELIGILDGVHEVLRISEPYKRASRTFKPENTVVTIDDVRVGGDEVIVMAGPCSAETEEQVHASAAAVKRAGAKILRGGAFKPRSSPYSFQGLGEQGLQMLRRAADAHNLKLISEVMDISQIELIAKYCDIFQVGARNMQNYTLLRELGHATKPVLLKRGISATIEEWLLSAEYILAGGNNDVILCERGIRTFETATRNTFDISAIPVVKKLSHLPVVADPSHGAGRRDMVAPMARAAVAAGADGLIIEVHNDPDHALSDGAQSMHPPQFERLMAELRIIAPAIGRGICLEPVARRGWAR
jgi:3-deoxy-7-phosphoheptulonate synthase